MNIKNSWFKQEGISYGVLNIVQDSWEYTETDLCCIQSEIKSSKGKGSL